MSIQVKLRRGTAGEHQVFTGALGELTMDTTNKRLMLHDGATAGGIVIGPGWLLDSSPGADHSVSGLKGTYTAGEALVFGDLCYFSSDGKMYKADAGASTTMPGVAICADSSIAADASGAFLKIGYARDDSWSFTAGDILYVSAAAGGITAVQPGTSGDQAQRVGYAVSGAVVWFRPSLDVLEVE